MFRILKSLQSGRLHANLETIHKCQSQDRAVQVLNLEMVLKYNVLLLA